MSLIKTRQELKQRMKNIGKAKGNQIPLNNFEVTGQNHNPAYEAKQTKLTYFSKDN